jgi:hypothetical protein
MRPLASFGLADAGLHFYPTQNLARYCDPGRVEAGSTCSKNTGAEGATTVNRAPNGKGKGAKREINTAKFWLEPALIVIYIYIVIHFIEK